MIFVFWLCVALLLASVSIVFTKWLARRSRWLRWSAAWLTILAMLMATYGLSSSGLSNESFTDLIPYQQVVYGLYFGLRGGTYPTLSLLLIAWMGLLMIFIPVLLFTGLKPNTSSDRLGRAALWKLQPFGIATVIAIGAGATALVLEDWAVQSTLRDTLTKMESLLQKRQSFLGLVPSNEDAAPAYQRLGVACQAPGMIPAWLAYGTSLDFHKHVTPEQLSEFVVKSRETFKALNEILQRPRVSMPTVQSLEDDDSMDLGALAAQWLVARCRENFDQRRNDEGWSDFLSLGKLADHAAQVPSLPMHTFRLRCFNDQSDLLVTLLAEGHVP